MTVRQVHGTAGDDMSLLCVSRTFADGFPNLFVKDATRIRNRHVAFLASFQHPITIFEQLSIIYQLPRMFVGSFTVVLPYFPTGTAERVSSASVQIRQLACIA